MTNTRTVSRAARIRDVAGLVARLVLAGVFLVSGGIKAADARETIVAVRAYQLLPESLVGTVAAILAGLVMVMFIAAVASAAARGLSIDCGCFGGGGEVTAGQTAYTAEILRDLAFLALAGYLVVRPGTPLSVDRLVQRRTADPM